MPFLWSDASQPAARWHGADDGPAHYFADTPVGAWAEFLRHEEITDEADLAGIRRALWAVEIPDAPAAVPALPEAVLRGGAESYARCRAEARRLRERGVRRLVTPSAALQRGGARGVVVERGARPGRARDGLVVVLFGRPTGVTGWCVVVDGRPPMGVLELVRPLRATRAPRPRSRRRPGSRAR